MHAMVIKLDEVTKQVAQLQEENARLKADNADKPRYQQIEEKTINLDSESEMPANDLITRKKGVQIIADASE